MPTILTAQLTFAAPPTDTHPASTNPASTIQLTTQPDINNPSETQETLTRGDWKYTYKKEQRHHAEIHTASSSQPIAIRSDHPGIRTDHESALHANCTRRRTSTEFSLIIHSADVFTKKYLMDNRIVSRPKTIKPRLSVDGEVIPITRWTLHPSPEEFNMFVANPKNHDDKKRLAQYILNGKHTLSLSITPHRDEITYDFSIAGAHETLYRALAACFE